MTQAHRNNLRWCNHDTYFDPCPACELRRMDKEIFTLKLGDLEPCSIHPESEFHTKCANCSSERHQEFIDGITAIHRKIAHTCEQGVGRICVRCFEVWPCETIKAINDDSC